MPKLETGFSVYLSSFDRQREMLERSAGTGASVFLSLHISEEFGPGYRENALEVCRFLADRGYRTIADVSRKTMDAFGEADLADLASRLGVWGLRVDYGLDDDEICALAARLPVVLNASTTSPESAARIAAAGPTVMAMHNFYPRPETGLDDAFFRASTQSLRATGLKVLTFIPGDEVLRGPLSLGLPTLERHRGLPPSACLADFAAHFEVDGVFVGDISVTVREQERMRVFSQEGIVQLPAVLYGRYQKLYGQVFTCRADSPAWLVRFAESREYSTIGEPVPAANCVERLRGAITLDNADYGRYSGEIQLTRRSFPADSRVNVIGAVPEAYHLLADCIRNGARFMLTKD
ncbi:MAG TPA: MupG family TIM beta-alpha barrel fold protein [Pseudoflavonifractor sp.]|nr:MupG family TIM beta-alpha barrel fold protein [Pseudoflavonifractor sp.]